MDFHKHIYYLLQTLHLIQVNDISLYKRITTIPKIEFLGLEFGGNFLVGNYVFYFKYADADGNETDFVEESGIVSIIVPAFFLNIESK